MPWEDDKISITEKEEFDRYYDFMDEMDDEMLYERRKNQVKGIFKPLFERKEND